MFTGIIEAVGQISQRTDAENLTTLVLKRPQGWELSVGQSIAVSGVCLTVVAFTDDDFTVELMPETLSKTVFGNTGLKTVNLERAMLANGRFEGHVVQGHADTVGEISAIDQVGETAVFKVSFPESFSNLVVEKGSITIEGVSLTVVEAGAGLLSAALIPHTLSRTTLGDKKPGEAVNLEFDILGKYILKNKLS